jgi:chromosome segregation ATPase
VRAVILLEQRLDRMEQMLSDLILSVGTLKAYFEEEKEENERRFKRIDERFEQIDRRFEQIDRRFEQIDRRFEQIDQRFEQIDQRFEQIDQRFEQIDQRFEQTDQRFERMDRRFDEVLAEHRNNKKEHNYMAARLFRAEMELEQLKEQLTEKS